MRNELEDKAREFNKPKPNGKYKQMKNNTASVTWEMLLFSLCMVQYMNSLCHKRKKEVQEKYFKE